MTLRSNDDAGRLIELRASPQRIVSLVPSVTELVCALGGEDRLVGVTAYCTEPHRVVAELPRIGGTKNPDCQRILDLRPDIVLINSEENRREDFDRLVAAGLSVYVTFPITVAGSARSIRRLGGILDVGEEASELADLIEEKLHAIGNPAHRLRFFCPIWRNPWMSFNHDTFAHDVLFRSGGDNVCAGNPDRYPVVDLQVIADRSPEIILLPDEPYHFSEKHRESLAPLAEAPAVAAGRVHFVDGKALSWYGPRTPAALDYFTGLLQP